MGALNSLKARAYQSKWDEDVTKREQLVTTPEEEATIVDIEVVAGEYSKSAKIETIDGIVKFISLNKDSQNLPLGMKLKPTKCLICHLTRGIYQTTEKLLYLDED